MINVTNPRPRFAFVRLLLLFLLLGAVATVAAARYTAAATMIDGTVTSTPLTSTPLTNTPLTNNNDEIVYLDAAGYLRIWDPQPEAGIDPVQWVSPIGGWIDFTLLDVNLDGDMEIVAVGGEANSGRMTIYDPVSLDENVDPDRITADIPWAILYEAPLLGRPVVVVSGELDLTVPGEEIAFVFELNAEDKLDPDDETRLSFLRAVVSGSEMPDGRAWERAAGDVDFGNTWERLSLGDLDGDGRAESVLTDDSVGLLRIYRLEEGEPVKIYENESGARPWLDSTVAQFIPSRIQQLALARSSNTGGSTLWVLYYNPADETGFSDSYTEFFLPPPRVIFHGDINGNGDDELFLLRDVPSSLPNRVRLIMRNGGEDQLPVFEHLLDPDNGYLAGNTGDTDGDGLAEVAIMRDNRIRLYTDPAGDPNAATEFGPPVLTNQRTIHLGNLDRNGYIELPRLGSVESRVEDVLTAGEQSSAVQPVNLSNANPENFSAIPFTVAVEGEPAWLIVEPRSGQTNARLNVRFDARQLQPGTYRTQIVIRATDPTVRNSPLAVDATLTVRPGLIPSAYKITSYYNCAERSGGHTHWLTLDGPTNRPFAAKILAGGAPAAAAAQAQPRVAAAPAVIWPSDVPWVTAASPNTLPTTMTIRFAADELPTGSDVGRAHLQISYFDTDGERERNIDLTLTCAVQQILLPTIAR